jgi:hypothetical protein
MNIAGKFLDLTQGVAEAALLSRLRSKYKMNFNLEKIAAEAKAELQEDNVPITPSTLLNKADDIAGRHATGAYDMAGIELSRWNPNKKEHESYIVPEPSSYFIR